ncbi:tyrosyl-DNA phosphodiesterase 1 isoform X2 [Aplysia californica]|uniref:Tyrosyl-DNA phosphodiesterase 1 isoform X2 n=1 Tax=Aplysia californica TaxID=6500 RepID=A0ABM0JZV7_APLCA|nr:tyrosyl-DNA phosphodiesterase 1 isoform X2 [Aplysia californica]
MSGDEELARKLQAQFDQEHRKQQEMEEKDRAMARAVAKAHSMSDSEDSDSANDTHNDTGISGSQDLFDSSSDSSFLASASAKSKGSGKAASDSKTSDDPYSADTDVEEEEKVNKDSKKPLCKRTHKEPQGKSPLPEKKRKKDDEKTPQDVFEEFQPFSLFLTKVKGIPDKFNNTGALSLKDILSTSMGQLKESCHFNFMFDMPWLMSQYPEHLRKLPVLLVHGEQGRDEINMKAEATQFSNISLCRARLEIVYGTHHTKMMLLLYKSGMRVVIHTANLIPNDWHQKTQGIWVSPLFPPLTQGEKGDSPTGFKTDLLQYLAAYKAPRLAHWERHIQAHDMSSANVHIVGSVPGRHTLNSKSCWGHLKLRKILSERGPEQGLVKNWPVSGQFSSIGSLGATKDAWMLGEFGDSLSTCKKAFATPLPHSKCHLIFPSVNNIRLSLEGYNGGGCVPYSIKTASKQVWMVPFFCQWSSEGRGRSRAVPHIKSYSRFSPDGTEAAWFMVTSANLSKAAWGAYEKQKSQLMIRSYEMGVLFLPQYFGFKNSFPVSSDAGEVAASDKPVFPLPYELPPVSYVKGDRPWFIDVPCVDQPDTFGTKWCPPL